MRIFSDLTPMSPMPNSPEGASSSPKVKGDIAPGNKAAKRQGPVQAPYKDPQEIREKVRAHFDKAQVKSKHAPAPPPFPETSLAADPSLAPKGDVESLQSPEKLRKILDSGTFQFSAQERAALEKILK